MKFIFGSSETENVVNFVKQIQEYLVEEANEWIDDKLILENFKPQNFEEYFRFLYCNYGEDFIKYHISSYFDITFFDELDDKENELNDQNIIIDHLLEYQKYNFLLYKNDNKIKAIVDLLSEKLFTWLEANIQNEEIEIIFAKKNNILDKIKSFFHKELLKFSINPNQNNEYSPSASNINASSKSTLAVIGFCLSLFILLSLQSPIFSVIIIALANISYLISILYKLFLSSIVNDEKKLEEEIVIKSQSIYTIFLPLYQEEKSIILQLISSIKNLNYNQHQLDVKILLEEHDSISEAIFSSIKLEYNFDIIVVPNGEKYGHPQTKARALNYGFNFSKGEHLAIYDGDNIPHPNQLINSLSEFSKNLDLSCIQHSIHPYNYNENLLTKFYSIEFNLWYKVFLKNMEKLDMPVTFGGTSNNFKIEALKNNLWDPYNVTEDADLGIRWWLNKNGKVKIIDIPTTEEAPISIKALVNQRSRWIKGFIQTYIVHFNYKFDTYDSRKVIFQYWINFFIALPIISQILFIPTIFEFLILKFVHHREHTLSLLGTFTLTSFLIFYLLMILPIIFNKNKMVARIDLSIILYPFYSIFLNILACHKAFWQFFRKPFYWEKTIHGVSNINNKEE
jgi:hypothetical protein